MSARKAKTETTVVAYKGTDKDMACRGFAFELGKTYEHDGKVVACRSGFHACENPFDVWSYYGPEDGNRFFRVTLGGELSRHGDDSKIAAGRITLDAELRLPDLVNDAVKWVIAATKGNKDNGKGSAKIGSSGYYAKIGSSGYSAQIGSSGSSAQIGSSGDYAKIGSSGDYAKIGSSGSSAKIGSSGDYAQIGSSGDYAKIGSSGYYAKIGSSGYSAQIGSSGDYAKIGSSGDYAKIDATGKAATIACAGQGSVARADEDGAICLAWNDGKRTRFAVGYVGENGIEAGVWYRAEAGKLVRAE
jgi:hypothetical protein